MKYNVRVFIDNPGEAYDPAPLHEFDMESDEILLPQVGDTIRWDATQPSYKIASRKLEYSSQRCVLWVCPEDAIWPI